jgi:hypothetical protein
VFELSCFRFAEPIVIEIYLGISGSLDFDGFADTTLLNLDVLLLDKLAEPGPAIPTALARPYLFACFTELRGIVSAFMIGEISDISRMPNFPMLLEALLCPICELVIG